MKKQILYIDMDGVIVDFEKGIKKQNALLEPSDKLDNWKEREKMVDDIVRDNPLFFIELEPIQGAIENIEKLWDYYDIYFLSTPMSDFPFSYSGKKIWIDKHFGEKAKKRLILTHRKDLCIGDYLIDDRDKNGAKEFKGCLITFLYYDNIWKDIFDFLSKYK
jgi:5'-nucleotidase